MKNNDSIALLLQKINERRASKEEINELIELLNRDEASELTQRLEFVLHPYKENDRKPLSADNIEKMAASILVMDHIDRNEKEVKQTPVRHIGYRRAWWAAAAILLLLGSGAYLWLHSNDANKDKLANAVVAHDVPPGTDGAILTLADGTQVKIDSSKSGLIAKQNGATVMLQNNQLVYDAQGTATAEIVYNTMSTPRGKQFNMTLPDGTKVWLNAGSSIRYPTVFEGEERRVEVTGEVYFEVAKNADKPFIAKAGMQEVLVLGTSFDMMAYNDEPALQTTLLEGAVRVTNGNPEDGKLLKPGQQVEISNGALQLNKEVDVEEVVAWKNGRFLFNNTDLKVIMKQVERWYDVDVIYKDDIRENYTITVPRKVPVSQLLKFMETSTGVHFDVEGKKITVRK